MAGHFGYSVVYQRGSVSRYVKAAVWRMTSGTCWYCGGQVNPFESFVVEHVVPLCRGGSDSIENLVPACTWCNQLKGTKTLEEWRLTHDCRANVLDSPWDGRFWFEVPSSPGESAGPIHGEEADTRPWTEREVCRNSAIIGYFCELDCREQGVT